jgi:hypothetical protein
MPAVIRRYSSKLLNFAAHSQEDSRGRQKMPFCAPSTDRTEWTVQCRTAGIRAADAAELSPFVANHPCSGLPKSGVGEPVPADGIVTVDVTTSS